MMAANAMAVRSRPRTLASDVATLDVEVEVEVVLVLVEDLVMELVAEPVEAVALVVELLP